MKVVFVVTESESYAVGLFSSLLKQRGHEAYLIFDPKIFGTNDLSHAWLRRTLDIRENNIKKIQKIQPDVVGFSVYTKDYCWALEMAGMIKRVIDVPIIFGGIHCTLVPEEVIKADCVDIVCVGEGEYALLELVDALGTKETNHNIKNLWFKDKEGKIIKNQSRPLIEDLDCLPFPDKDIFFEQKPILSKGYIINSGRGCPHNCAFCVSGTLNRYYTQSGLGRYVRQRSVENVIEELVWAKKKYNYKNVNFTDDVFTMNPDWLKDFAAEYKQKINIPFFCTANPGSMKDEELKLLKYANCHMIGFGIQSVSEETRRKTLHRGGLNKRILEVARLCHRLKIHFWFDHIFNIPGEDEKEQVEALDFYNQARPDVINTFWMTYFPKTAIIDIALEKGILDQEMVKKINKGETSTSLLVGAGCKYSFSAKGMFDTFAFLFIMLPFMPKWFVRKIIKKHWYRYGLSMPFLARLAIKDLARLKIGRFEEVFFPIRLLLMNIFDNLKIKICDN
jgi:radical SAM superfamily enzyme YgiQ (UPF0313 family)